MIITVNEFTDNEGDALQMRGVPWGMKSVENSDIFRLFFFFCFFLFFMDK